MKDKKVFNHKGYTGSIEVSLEDGCLFGQILFVNDTVTYEAESVSQLETEFIAAVDDYLETCEEIGVSPDKPFSGTFNVRIGPDLHQQAVKAAFMDSLKLNEFVTLAIKERLDQLGNGIVHHHLHTIEYREIIEITKPLLSGITINETVPSYNPKARKVPARFN